MKHGKTLLGALILLILPVVAWAGLAHAQDFRTGNNVTVAQNQTINSTLWTSGHTIDVAGTVNGDVFCAGQNINISAAVHGDIICAGQDVRITGPVSGDVRVAGQNVSVSSKVSGNLSLAAQSFTLDQTGSIGGDASIASSDVVLNGTVGRDLAGAASAMTLSNQVGRNAKLTVSKLSLNSGAKIGGSLAYTSKNNANVAQGATVVGATHRSEPQQHEQHGLLHAAVIFGLYVFVSLLIVALVLVLLLPRLFVVVTDVMVVRPWWTLLAGFLATLIFLMLFLVLLATLVGIPLALLLLCAWMLIFDVGSLAFSFYIGRLIFRGRGNAVLTMLVGAIIVLAALMVPILGFIVFLAMTWWGIGMVLSTLWRHFQRPSYAMATVATPTAPVGERAATNRSASARTNTRRKKV